LAFQNQLASLKDGRGIVQKTKRKVILPHHLGSPVSLILYSIPVAQSTLGRVRKPPQVLQVLISNRAAVVPWLLHGNNSFSPRSRLKNKLLSKLEAAF
jgi:hypothetical protein